LFKTITTVLHDLDIFVVNMARAFGGHFCLLDHSIEVLVMGKEELLVLLLSGAF